MNESIEVRALAHVAAGLFALTGIVVMVKGLWDCFGGQPEANFFSPAPWMFVTRDQWMRYVGFELCYGLACGGLALAAVLYGRRWPETRTRAVSSEDFL